MKDIDNKIPMPDFSLKSMVDDFGRVFFVNGGVYRVIQNDKIEYCLELINSNLFRELSKEGLVPKTEIAKIQIDGYKLILKHEKLLEILQHEWSFDMLKNAATVVLKTNEICNRYGYELKDAHTLNVLFRGTDPVMIDIGSISKKKLSGTGIWRAYDDELLDC